jgi:hypothetical protein
MMMLLVVSKTPPLRIPLHRPTTGWSLLHGYCVDSVCC